MDRRRVMLSGASGNQPQYLYNSGIISPLIGGFDTSKQLWACEWPWTPAVLRDTDILFSGGGNEEHIAGALLPVDLTPYKVLCADVHSYNTYSDYSAVRIAVFTNPYYVWDNAIAKTPKKGIGLGHMVIRVDISNINQIAYIGASAGGVSAYIWVLNELWLEK